MGLTMRGSSPKEENAGEGSVRKNLSEVFFQGGGVPSF